MSRSIHPTAIVHRRAELGNDVVIGPYAVVGHDVVVGDNCILHNHVTVQGPTVIGCDNIIFPYAVIGAEPQDLKYQGLDTQLRIGDRNKIREHVTIHRGTELGGGHTAIGNDCLFMVGVHIAHDCIIKDHVVIANTSMLGGHCLVEDGATLAGGVGVHHFSTVGTLSFVGGMARVTRDVPPFMLVEGQPAEVRKVNTTALARRKWTDKQIESLKSAYRELFRSEDRSFNDSVALLRTQIQTCPATAQLVAALEASQAGTYGRALEQRNQAN